jgi:hypothetical protein
LKVYAPEGLTVNDAPDGNDITVGPEPSSIGSPLMEVTVSLSPSGSESLGNIVDDTGINASVLSESSSAAGAVLVPLISMQATASLDS